MGEPIDPVVRDLIVDRDGMRCRYCQRIGGARFDPDGEWWHVDHIEPRSRGGSLAPPNLALACRRCNMAKRDRTPFEWLHGEPEPVEPALRHWYPDEVSEACRKAGGWRSITAAAATMGISWSTAKKRLERAERAGLIIRGLDAGYLPGLVNPELGDEPGEFWLAEVAR